ncbi:unnamed protein product [Diamesa hyperborea]
MLTRGNVKPLYYRILSKFPPNYGFVFAYGSGVKKQIGYDGSKEIKTSKQTMIDLIYCVDNPFLWHAQNIEKNPSHYSGLMKNLGVQSIAKYQESYGAEVYFNTLVPIEDENILIKYGVISSKAMITDLLDWSYLYCAGRLQKPVEIVRSPGTSIQNALELNLQSALHAALLLLPKEFTEYELYYTVSNLSYNGDFRMIFGENKNKVENIVKPQLESFRNLYFPAMKVFNQIVEFPNEDVIFDNKNMMLRQDKSPHIILQHLNQLPKWPIRRIVKDWNKGKYRQDTEDVLRAVAVSPMYQDIVRKSLSDIVWRSSIFQSIKNIPTSGFQKSTIYMWTKALKTFGL